MSELKIPSITEADFAMLRQIAEKLVYGDIETHEPMDALFVLTRLPALIQLIDRDEEDLLAKDKRIAELTSLCESNADALKLHDDAVKKIAELERRILDLDGEFTARRLEALLAVNANGPQMLTESERAQLLPEEDD